MTEIIDSEEIPELLPEPWKLVDGKPTARWDTDGFSAGAKFVVRVAEIADELNHHPDALVTYPSVEITTISHDVNAITGRDIQLARQVSVVAADMGLAASK